jgi:hypothetical protein
MTVQVVGNAAIVRHLWVAQTELECKVTDTKIGVMQVWQKQDGDWEAPGARLIPASAAGIKAPRFFQFRFKPVPGQRAIGFST